MRQRVTSDEVRDHDAFVRAQQADGADRNRGAVDRTPRSWRQHIGEPFDAERRA